MKKYLATFALSTISTLSFADSYVGADYAFLEAGDVDLGAVAFKAGHQLNDWAALEVRAGFGVDDDRIHGVKAELEHYYGGYFVAGLPNDTVFYPYAIAGYTKGKVKASFGGLSGSEDESDFSYGIGTRLAINELFSASVEVMRYIDTSDVEIDAVSLGVIYTF